MKEKISDVLVGLFITIFGICLVAWADNVTNILSTLIGVAFLLFGIVRIINYYKNKDICSPFELIFAIISLVFGGVLLFRSSFLKELISFIVGIYMVLSSLNAIANVLYIQKRINQKMTKSLVMNIIGCVIGVFCILGKFILPDLFLQFIGIMMAVFGVMSIVSTLLIPIENENK